MVLFCICAVQLKAQEVRLLPLEEAVQLAKIHNLQLKSDSVQINILNARVSHVKKSLLPDIGLDGNYTRISDNITPFTVSFPTGEETLNPQILNQSFNSVQLKQLIWTGGKLKYGIEISEKRIAGGKF